jgi:hypothetical protein
MFKALAPFETELVVGIGFLFATFWAGATFLPSKPEAESRAERTFRAGTMGALSLAVLAAFYYCGWRTSMMFVPILYWLYWGGRVSFRPLGGLLEAPSHVLRLLPIVSLVVGLQVYRYGGSEGWRCMDADWLFYARLADWLPRTGQENLSRSLNLLEPAFAHGVVPYHYPELWLGGLVAKGGSLPALVALVAIVFPLLLALCLQGLYAYLRDAGHFHPLFAFLAALVLVFPATWYPAQYYDNAYHAVPYVYHQLQWPDALRLLPLGLAALVLLRMSLVRDWLALGGLLLLLPVLNFLLWPAALAAYAMLWLRVRHFARPHSAKLVRKAIVFALSYVLFYLYLSPKVGHEAFSADYLHEIDWSQTLVALRNLGTDVSLLLGPALGLFVFFLLFKPRTSTALILMFAGLVAGLLVAVLLPTHPDGWQFFWLPVQASLPVLLVWTLAQMPQSRMPLFLRWVFVLAVLSLPAYNLYHNALRYRLERVPASSFQQRVPQAAPRIVGVLRPQTHLPPHHQLNYGFSPILLPGRWLQAGPQDELLLNPEDIPPQDPALRRLRDQQPYWRWLRTRLRRDPTARECRDYREQYCKRMGIRWVIREDGRLASTSSAF